MNAGASPSAVAEIRTSRSCCMSWAYGQSWETRPRREATKLSRSEVGHCVQVDAAE